MQMSAAPEGVNAPTSIPYEDRVVAYLDLLGFRSLVERIDSTPEVLSKLIEILTKTRSYSKLGPAMDATAASPGNPFFNMFQMSTFSDSIAMSAKNNAIGIGIVMSYCLFVSLDLLSEGIMVRGAVTRGRLYHANGLVIGRGLTDAYLLESKAAIYPRILIAEEVAADVQKMKSDFLDLRR